MDRNLSFGSLCEALKFLEDKLYFTRRIKSLYGPCSTLRTPGCSPDPESDKPQSEARSWPGVLILRTRLPACGWAVSDAIGSTV